WVHDPAASPKLALARLYKATGRVDDAMQCTAAFCAMVDEAVDLRWELVEYHKSKKEWSAMLALLDEIMECKPFDVRLWMARAEVREEMGQKAEACDELLLALDAAGSDRAKELRIRVRLGKLLLDLGRKDDALFHLERAVEMNPDDKEAADALRRAEGS